jgi:hypothetical protein
VFGSALASLPGLLEVELNHQRMMMDLLEEIHCRQISWDLSSTSEMGIWEMKAPALRQVRE